MRVVCATANPHKAAEIAEILAGRVDLVPRPEGVAEVDESADTLEGNARLKAAALVAATGLPALADDTGLEVDVLDGDPGVRSARFAGERATDAENRALLLERLERAQSRTARFRTVVVLRRLDGAEIVAEGTCAGSIAKAERGTGGFGYDSLFVPDEGDGRTFAEMTSAEKHHVSHRGRALRALADRLGTG